MDKSKGGRSYLLVSFWSLYVVVESLDIVLPGGFLWRSLRMEIGGLSGGNDVRFGWLLVLERGGDVECF